MKSMNPKEVKLGPQAMQDLVKKQIKDGKAKAMHYDDAEVKKILAFKLKEKLHRQQSYRDTVLARMYKGEEYEVYVAQIKGEITMQWSGMVYPKKLLQIESLIVWNQYLKLVSEEKYLFESLKNDGLDDGQIQLIVSDAKYYTEAKDFNEPVKDD